MRLPTSLVAPLLLTMSPHPLRLGRPLAQAGSGEEGGGIQVSLREPETDRTLECYLLQTTEADSAMYACMTPVDTPVAIATLDDGVMVEIDDPERLDEIFPVAEAVCSEMDLTLLQTPVTLTVAGELDGLGDEDGDEDDEDDDMPELEGADEVDEDEEGGVEVLLSFEHEGDSYYVVQPLEPCIVVGRQIEGAKFDVPLPSEMIRVGPALEQLVKLSLAEDEDQ